MWRIYEVDDIYSSFLEFVQSSIATLSHSQTHRNNSGGMIYDIHHTTGQ